MELPLFYEKEGTAILERVSFLLRLSIYGPSREKICFRGFANNKGTDQHAHPRRLIRDFVIPLLESIISRLTTSKISNFMLVSVAEKADLSLTFFFLYPPQTLFVVGILFSRPSVRASVRPSVTFCFLNILKSPCWIFIKPCKHVHICMTNTLDKKVRARGQFY